MSVSRTTFFSHNVAKSCYFRMQRFSNSDDQGLWRFQIKNLPTETGPSGVLLDVDANEKMLNDLKRFIDSALEAIQTDGVRNADGAGIVSSTSKASQREVPVPGVSVPGLREALEKNFDLYGDFGSIKEMEGNRMAVIFDPTDFQRAQRVLNTVAGAVKPDI